MNGSLVSLWARSTFLIHQTLAVGLDGIAEFLLKEDIEEPGVSK